MPTPTYTPLATVTLGTSAASVAFSSIPATYRDLVLVFNGTGGTAGNAFKITINSDSTANNYRTVFMAGDGSNPQTGTRNGTDVARVFEQVGVGTGLSTGIIQFMDYSATDKHKTVLSRCNSPGGPVSEVNRYASTSAITTFSCAIASSFQTGSTFNLYGIVS